MDVDGGREQHVRAFAPRFSADALADGAYEARVPRRAERGAARERRRRAARPPLAAPARAVGDLERGDSEARDRGRVPEVDAGDHRRLLVDGELADELIDACVHGGISHRPPAHRIRARSSLPGMIRSETREHITTVTIDNPPVNALPVAGWFQLADALRAAGRDTNVRAVILCAEGKGFQAGVDIKELAADPTKESLVEVNRGCYEAFGAVYDCAVPVIAAVQGFCLGGGVGLAGNADIVVASEDATFGLPEVDRGALGVATHLARFVPQHKLRAMFLMGSMITAQELLAFGTVERVVPREQLYETALEIANVIAAKSPIVMRRAKESLNLIDPVDVKRSYRAEQGFTFELNLWGDSDELRRAFVDKRDAELPDT